jgi:hypothetical protein
VQVDKNEMELFQKLLDENRYDFQKLVYIIFPFGQVGHPLEHMKPYDWQMEEFQRISKHLSNPITRYETYRIIISSGNGAAKTAFGAMLTLMLMYTQQLRARITANTDPQMKSIIWPEYDNWFRYARYHDFFFEKFGTSIKAKNEQLAETWRLDAVTWNETSPQSISGLHNKGKAIAYIFEEAPGIPAVIWQYASGAFTETQTIKVFMAFGNSDDPESKFEQNMTSSLWNARRIDTRTLKHIDPKQIEDWLMEVGGNEDHDEFRVRVRGLPRKTSKDSIIGLELVQAAIARAKDFDKSSVEMLPGILSCDPAWTGGDETTIWFQQGNYKILLDKYKLDKSAGETHMLTYQKLCHWESTMKADAVFIDQGEGTALYTIAMNAGKTSWELVSFASSPNDFPEAKDSEYANIRAQMYYEANKWLMKEGVIDAKDPEWFAIIEKQLCWTKGGRHKVTSKKLCEAKLEIKNRVGQSPDVADGFVLCHARPVMERLPENDVNSGADHLLTGQQPYRMPNHSVDEMYEMSDDDLYN